MKNKGFDPRVDAEQVLELIQNDAYGEVGESSDGYLEDIKDIEIEELERMLTNTFNIWAKRYNYEPKFNIVENEKEVEP